MTLNQSPYLRTQRQFPANISELSAQCDQAYIDVASKVNARIIGTYALGQQIVTGEKWFLQGQPSSQQTLRQIYTFTGAGNIAHGINTSTVSRFTKCTGSYTDGTSWYGVLFAGSTAIPNQVSFYITSTNIVVSVDGTAPAVSSGMIIIEWLSQI